MLKVDAADVKNGQALEFELQPETVALARPLPCRAPAAASRHRRPLSFPGQGRRPEVGQRHAGRRSPTRSGSTAASPSARISTGTSSPRSSSSAIPGLYIAVSRHLGHRSIDTTLGSYLGTETRAASRRLNRLLVEARDNPELEDD